MSRSSAATPWPSYRATLRRRPCIAAIAPSSTSVPAGCRSSIRLAPVAPEPTELLIDLPVSSAAFPLFFPTHLYHLGHSSTMAEAHLRSSLSPASLQRPFGHPVLCNVLAASRSASLAPQFPCLHAAAQTPHMAELRPPPWSSPSSSPATVGPASTTTRCATARPLQRAQERPRPCPVGVFQAVPPSRASPATQCRWD